MTFEVRTGGSATEPPVPSGTVLLPAGPGAERPNVSGDLPSVLAAAPMFARRAVGYDRFQVDTYVQWAEQELAAADRERQRLEERHLRTRAELDEARERLSRTPGAGQLVDVSRSIGALLAAAADEAEVIRADAAAERVAAGADAEELGARARAVLAAAEVEAGHLLVRAVSDAGAMAAAARRLVAEAGETVRSARAEARARLAEVARAERQATEHAAQLVEDARAEIAAAREQAREEVRAMLVTACEERRRADDRAASARDRLDREAAVRLRGLLSALEDLEEQRSVLQAGVDALAGAAPGTPPGTLPGNWAGVAQQFPPAQRRWLRRLGGERPSTELLGSP